jgi:hypothetical protein
MFALCTTVWFSVHLCISESLSGYSDRELVKFCLETENLYSPMY